MAISFARGQLKAGASWGRRESITLHKDSFLLMPGAAFVVCVCVNRLAVHWLPSKKGRQPPAPQCGDPWAALEAKLLPGYTRKSRLLMTSLHYTERSTYPIGIVYA